MDLKDSLGKICGKAIETLAVRPDEVPCFETSDAACLCRHPVVSVHMVAYNHETYIRQAIDGVIMQKTDFEYELIIGEDCSSDKTREICFEYQRRYPEKIRVLWSEHNVNEICGNGRRVFARCRGEYIAFCEGDDFWTDPLKLQKQVDVMRQHANVGICFCGVNTFYEKGGKLVPPLSGQSFSGLVNGLSFVRYQLYGDQSCFGGSGTVSLQTPGLLVRRSVLDEAMIKFDIFNWKLLLGDVIWRLGCASLSDVWFFSDAMATYRKNAGGITSRRFAEVMRDDTVVALYFSMKTLGLSWEDALRRQERRIVRTLVNNAVAAGPHEQRSLVREKIPADPILKEFFGRFWALPLTWLLRFGLLTPRLAFHLNRAYWHLPRFWMFH